MSDPVFSPQGKSSCAGTRPKSRPIARQTSPAQGRTGRARHVLTSLATAIGTPPSPGRRDQQNIPLNHTVIGERMRVPTPIGGLKLDPCTTPLGIPSLHARPKNHESRIFEEYTHV